MTGYQAESNQLKDERINLRLKLPAKSLLERAARFEGKTLSNFILNCALSQAEKTIHEHETISLNIRESEAFYDALSQPVTFNKKLLQAFEEHDNSVKNK